MLARCTQQPTTIVLPLVSVYTSYTQQRTTAAHAGEGNEEGRTAKGRCAGRSWYASNNREREAEGEVARSTKREDGALEQGRTAGWLAARPAPKVMQTANAAPSSSQADNAGDTPGSPAHSGRQCTRQR